MQAKSGWDNFSPEQVEYFLRVGPEGKEHPSRAKVVSLLDGLGSLLDVGCGTGVMFEIIRDRRPDLDYTGVDFTEQFIRAVRIRYPLDVTRFIHCALDELASLDRTFDAVLARHVIEHLPDYVPATQQIYACAKRKLILVFYLPPRPLAGPRKLDERFEAGFYTHTYDLAHLVDHLLNELSPPPKELRIHPRQGYSDRSMPWGDRQNVIYEIIRADTNQSQRRGPPGSAAC